MARIPTTNIYDVKTLGRLATRVEEKLLQSHEDCGIRGPLERRTPRDGVREITNGFERIVLQVFEKILPESSCIRSLGTIIPRLEKHYQRSRESDPSGPLGFEYAAYSAAVRAIWHLYFARNWVAHESRQVIRDDYVECLRAFDLVLDWYQRVMSEVPSAWFIPVEVEGTYLMETETNRAIRVPKSVIRLKKAFETAYRSGDYSSLQALIDEDFTSPNVEFFADRKTMMTSIREFHQALGGCDGLHFELEVKGFELDTEGCLWWQIQFCIQKQDVIHDEHVYKGRLTGLRDEVARLLELRGDFN